MILEARTTDEIASAFHVSRKTVANYHYNIKSKLGVSSDIELLYFGLQHGVIAPIAPLPDPRKITCNSPWLGRLRKEKYPGISRTTLHFCDSLQGSICGLIRSPNGARIREVSNV